MGRKDESEYKKIKSVSTDKRKNNLNNTGKQWTGERGFSNSFTICVLSGLQAEVIPFVEVERPWVLY